jgi:hypothetical protein
MRWRRLLIFLIVAVPMAIGLVMILGLLSMGDP